MVTERPSLPEIESVDTSKLHVDGTPDGRYALRILKAYRERCNQKWIVSGLSAERIALWQMMNENQDQRAIELDEAIRLLEEHLR